VNPTEIGHCVLAALPADVVLAVAHHVCDAKLHAAFGNTALMAFMELF
jgi:hypothetical protein